MSSPYDTTNQDGTPGIQSFDGADDSNPDIPRRVMRVKVLYTFDNDNKTHCLARLVKPVPIQVVALDENTQIGVVELRTCIQAIVAASPEMIAKLENDYTVYAYDYSEYETPLVGQGMLSWVLATASPTPNAPARDSGTMVTGRVCKNIMGLFGPGGIKETLEVKLKLVPVPTRSKREYLQSMAVYRDPNVVMPEGFDNNAWMSFLQAIPDCGALRDGSAPQANARANAGGMEQLHDMLTPKFGGQDEDMFSNGPGSSRPASPTPSQRSMSNHPNAYHPSRPASRTSFSQPQLNESAVDDQGFEDGPAKKRARLTQTDWHGRGSFGANADSLRAAVSTAASIRSFRPSIAGSSSAGIDMIPRAPTPRASEKRLGRPGMPRAGSSLRRESTGGLPTYSNREPELTRNDSGIYSNEYDGGSSHHGSPSPDLPSSPPEFTPIEPASSPLPELPQVPDSGFQSDLPSAQEQRTGHNNAPPPVNIHLARQAKGMIEWTHVQPGPQENLPTTSFPHFDPISQRSAMAAQWKGAPTSPVMRPAYRRGGRARSKPAQEPPSRQTSATPLPLDATSPNMQIPLPSIENSVPPTPIDHPTAVDRPDPLPPRPTLTQAEFDAAQSSNGSHLRPKNAPASNNDDRAAMHRPQRVSSQGPANASYAVPEREGKQTPGTRTGRPPKRALQKAQTWTAPESSDVESDGGFRPSSIVNKTSRSKGGSGMVRSQSIYKQLDSAVATGAPVKFCCNCGEIKTSTWRPYWLKIEEGSGDHIPVGAGTGVHMVEAVQVNEEGQVTKCRVYKQYGHLTPEEKKPGSDYQQHYFCNPCGDFIRKYAKIRPREMWDPAFMKPIPRKKGSKTGKKRGTDALTSDMPMPSSEWDMPTPFSEMPFFTDPFGPSEAYYDMPPPSTNPHTNATTQAPSSRQPDQLPPPTSTPAQAAPQKDEIRPKSATEISALQKAIQSSPARNLEPRDKPTEAEDEIITPKPTRRLLFPSPRKDGEFKSLDNVLLSKASTNNSEASCSSSGSNSKMQFASNKAGEAQQSQQEQALSTTSSTESSLELDKENLPPPMDDDDEFAHLFDEGIFQSPHANQFKTPSKGVPRTPKSKSRALFDTGLTPRTINTGLTPKTGSKRSADCMGPPDTPTPTKRRSPRIAEKHQKESTKEMTPFTRSLNQFLSDGMTSSPSRAFNWTLTSSPAKNLNSTFGDMAAMSKIAAASNGKQYTEENLWSDFPMPSSPPFFAQNKNITDSGFEDYDWSALDVNLASATDLGVDVWEDGTATDPAKGWEAVFDEEEKATKIACGELDDAGVDIVAS